MVQQLVETAATMEPWRRTEAAHRALLREANETLARPENGDGHTKWDVFLCECGDRACGATIELTAAEYEAIRTSGTQFALARNHENPESEQVVFENDRYAVIDAMDREAREFARKSDPRTQVGR